MSLKNRIKTQKTIKIKGKIPVSVHFFRDAEAEAINVKREQLDRATLITCAVEHLRETPDGGKTTGKEPGP